MSSEEVVASSGSEEVTSTEEVSSAPELQPPPCAACRNARKRCTPECVFATYIKPEEEDRYAPVHRVFGRSNVSEILASLPAEQRAGAVESLLYQAAAATS